MNQNVPKTSLFAQIPEVDFPVVYWIFDYWIFQRDPPPPGDGGGDGGDGGDSNGGDGGHRSAADRAGLDGVVAPVRVRWLVRVCVSHEAACVFEAHLQRSRVGATCLPKAHPPHLTYP